MEKYSENAQVLLGQRIRYLRKLKKWTLEELGEKAATNHKHIGEIERGQQNPSYAVLVKISDALEVELPELFRFETEELSRKEVEREIARIVKSVPEEDLRQVLSVLRMIYPVRQHVQQPSVSDPIVDSAIIGSYLTPLINPLKFHPRQQVRISGARLRGRSTQEA